MGLGVLAVICKTFLLPVLNFDILQDRQKGLPLFTLARFVDEDTAVCMDRCVYLHIQTTVLSRKEGKDDEFLDGGGGGGVVPRSYTYMYRIRK